MTGMIDYESLCNTLDHFAKTAYPFEFQAESSGLYCAHLDLRLAPDEFDIAEVYHFGETASRQEEHVLYLISSLPGLKGTLVLAAADVYSDNMSFEMAQKLRTHPYGEWICS
jgi:hypothetical protein